MHEADHAACVEFYSGLILDVWITFAHFAVSSAMNLPNSAGVIGIGSLPTSVSRSIIFGSAKPAFTSLLSFATISAEIPFGAPMPISAPRYGPLAGLVQSAP